MAATRINLVRPNTEAIAAAETQQRKFQDFINSAEYRDAVRKENEARDFAFVDLPENVCGVRLRQLTALDLLKLSLVRSPFIASDFISGKLKAIDSIPVFASEVFMADKILIPRHHVTAFLWMQSLEFSPLRGLRARWRHFWHTYKCGALKYGEACEAIQKYMDSAMMDRRASGDSKESTSYTSWLASTVAFVSNKFHWSEHDLLNMPVARLFQYERAIILNMGGSSSLSNRSNQLRKEFLQKCKAERMGKN